MRQWPHEMEGTKTLSYRMKEGLLTTHIGLDMRRKKLWPCYAAEILES